MKWVVGKPGAEETITTTRKQEEANKKRDCSWSASDSARRHEMVEAGVEKMRSEQKRDDHRANHNGRTEHLHRSSPEAEPSIDADKLSYEIFSILESKFLFGYDDAAAAPGAAAPPPPQPPLVKNQRGKVCILSIDGCAGLRGVIVGKALAYLEQAIQSRSGDPGARISDYFDVAAGTGVGGIFTAMLFAAPPSAASSRPICSADSTWRFLSDNGRRFFARRRQSSGASVLGCFNGNGGGGVAKATAGMERSLKEVFGEELTLRNTRKPVLIPCYDLRSSAPFVFSRADALEAESYDFRLWEVCRATWAEPGRFEPVELRSVDGSTVCVGVDGGLAMTNPAAAAITHVLHNKQEFPFVRGVEDLLVLSLSAGSGGGNGTTQPSSSLDYEKVKRWRSKDWARPIARIASDGAADLVDHAVAMAFSNSRSSGNYVRIQPHFPCRGSSSSTADIDGDPSPGNVKRLVGMAEEMLEQKNVESVLFGGMKRIGEMTNSEKLDWFATELVLEHQRRSCRIAPTVAFKQAAPPRPPNPEA